MESHRFLYGCACLGILLLTFSFSPVLQSLPDSSEGGAVSVADSRNEEGLDAKKQGDHFLIDSKQKIYISGGQSMEWKVLCSSATYGPGGPKMPIECNRAKNGEYLEGWIWRGKLVPGEEYHEDHDGEGQDAYQLKCHAQYEWWFNRTIESTDKLHVKVLLHGDSLVDHGLLRDEDTASECLGDYVDESSSVTKLKSCQALLFFEIEENLEEVPNNPLADFQDLVILLTVGDC